MTAVESRGEVDRVVAEIVARHPDLVERGVAIVEHRAARGGTFSANDLRGVLRAAGIGPRQSGAVFATASRRGHISIVGWVMHTEARTRHRIAVYEQRHQPAASLTAVTVPVIRDRDGRFTTDDTQPYDVPLFDINPKDTR